MKKLLSSILAAFIIFGATAHAYAADTPVSMDQQRQQLIEELIQVLLQQVALLQEQIKELQARDSVIQKGSVQTFNAVNNDTQNDTIPVYGEGPVDPDPPHNKQTICHLRGTFNSNGVLGSWSRGTYIMDTPQAPLSDGPDQYEYRECSE